MDGYFYCVLYVFVDVYDDVVFGFDFVLVVVGGFGYFELEKVVVDVCFYVVYYVNLFDVVYCGGFDVVC